MFLTWIALTTAVAAPAPRPVVADAVLAQRLGEIDALIAARDYSGAIRGALERFGLNASNCRGLDTRFIEGRDENGNAIIAHTQLDQIVVLDPRQTGFRNARFLVSILAHEITHCDQNQHLYTLALSTDRELALLKDRVNLLRVLADLDEVASVAVKDSPARAEAVVQFRKLMERHGLDLTAPQFLALVHRFMDDIQAYKRDLGELQEMEACLRAFDVPGVLRLPRGAEKAGDEFATQFRVLAVSTTAFLHRRQLFGATPETACQLANLVPFEMTMSQERVCGEAVRMVRDFMGKVD